MLSDREAICLRCFSLDLAAHSGILALAVAYDSTVANGSSSSPDSGSSCGFGGCDNSLGAAISTDSQPTNYARRESRVGVYIFKWGGRVVRKLRESAGIKRKSDEDPCYE